MISNRKASRLEAASSGTMPSGAGAAFTGILAQERGIGADGWVKANRQCFGRQCTVSQGLQAYT